MCSFDEDEMRFIACHNAYTILGYIIFPSCMVLDFLTHYLFNAKNFKVGKSCKFVKHY